MPRPIKSKGDGRPVSFPKLWPGHRDEGGNCPYKDCPVPGGTGELCDDDHCRELPKNSVPSTVSPNDATWYDGDDDPYGTQGRPHPMLDEDPGDGYQGSWEHNSGHGAHYGRF